MLRASAAANKVPVNLAAVTNPLLDSGIEHGEVLLAFADAVTGAGHGAMEAARTRLLERMGSGALVQAAAIAANFTMNDCAANAIGIPMESPFLADSVAFRRELGIDDFPSARNTPRR
jgi:hypothetical protein